MVLDKVVSRSPVGFIKSLVQQYFKKEELKYPLSKESWIRMSAVSSLCAREEVLVARFNVIRKDKITSDLNLTFLHGTSLHWGVQNKLLPSIGVMKGIWICLGCGRRHGISHKPQYVDSIGFVDATNFCVEGLVFRPSKCDCGCIEFLFEEVHLKDDALRVSGHCDAFLVIPGLPGVGIGELKSINPRGAWAVRDVPDVGHVIQLQGYLWLANLSWGKILYWDKAGFGLSALIEHHIERDENTINEIKNMLRSLRKGLEGGVLPERVCKVDSCEKAQKCCVVKQCFAEADSTDKAVLF
jgi:hypothetical protein